MCWQGPISHSLRIWDDTSSSLSHPLQLHIQIVLARLPFPQGPQGGARSISAVIGAACTDRIKSGPWTTALKQALSRCVGRGQKLSLLPSLNCACFAGYFSVLLKRLDCQVETFGLREDLSKETLNLCETKYIMLNI